MIKAHWVRLLAFAVGGGLLALVVSLLAPRQYEGFVQILIDQKPQVPTVTADPADGAVRDLTDFARSRSIVTQVEQLTGFDVLKRAGIASANQLSVPSNRLEEFTPINLHERVSVEAEQGSDIITLRVRMSDPDYAKSVAGEIYNAFEEQNTANARVFAERAVQYLNAQSTDILKELKAVDNRMTEIRRKHNAPDLAAQVQAEINALALLKQARDTAMIEHQASLQRVTVLEQQIATLPRDIESSTSETLNPVVSSLEQSLAQARADRAQLLAHNLEDSDRIRAINARIRQIEADLKATRERLEGPSTRSPNPNYQNLLQAIAEAKATAASYLARVTQGDVEIAEAQKRLDELPDAQNEIADLLRKQTVLEKISMNYSSQLESLKLAQQGRLAPTRLVTPASAVPMPVSPKPIVNTILGLLVGLLVGVLSMFSSEARKQPIRTLAQLNGLSLNPVYRVVPEMRVPFRGVTSAPQESYESLLANCLKSGRRPYRLGVVGVNPDSGASTAAINLAIAASRHSLRTVIVSNDPKSSVKRYLWRSGAVPEGDVVRVNDMIEWLPEEEGKIVASGAEKGSKLSDAMGLPEKDLTIFDFEPAMVSAEYAFLGAHLDEVVLLVRANHTRSVEFLTAQQALKDAGCRTITVVFTRTGDLEVATDSMPADAAPLAS